MFWNRIKRRQPVADEEPPRQSVHDEIQQTRDQIAVYRERNPDAGADDPTLRVLTANLELLMCHPARGDQEVGDDLRAALEAYDER